MPGYSVARNTGQLIVSIERDTLVDAWLSCIEAFLRSEQTTRFNLVVGIRNAVLLNESEEKACRIVDRFLRSHHSLPLITVANTIFPGGFYRDAGIRGVYEDFPESYRATKEGWGTYAGRLFADKVTMKGGSFSRIERLVGKLRRNAVTGRMRASYEVDALDTVLDEDISTYCVESDAGMGIGQPCLVHLSFKLHADNSVSLTAVYRSQYYIAKALGNFVGLGQLLAFVAGEAGLTPSYLVCHATLAELDLGNARARWKKDEIRELVLACRLAIQALTAEPVSVI